VPKAKEPDENRHCSFCNKSQSVAGKLISNPGGSARVYICDECVMVCSSIIRDVGDADPRSGWTFAEPIEVLLEPDVALVFRDAASVNEALRHLIAIAARTSKPDS